jgi:CheY-like chemotaxis protein
MRIKRQSDWVYVQRTFQCSGTASLRRILPLLLIFLASLFQAIGVERGQSNNAPAGSTATSDTNKSVPDTVAAEMEIAALQKTITNQLQEIVTRSAAVENTVRRHEGVLGTFAVLLIALLLMLRFGRRMTGMAFGRSKSATAEAESLVGSPTSRAEEEAFAKFAASFRIGPKPNECNKEAVEPVAASASPSSSTPPPKQAPVRHCAPEEFLALAPMRVAYCRNLLHEAGRATGEPARHKILVELAAKVVALKEDASHPHLGAFWQVISTLEGLLKQLTDKPANINSSTLRTLAGCVDLLDGLCSAGLKPDLLKTPPVRFLAVDDDPISRHTISFALKRALNPPDLAENGAAGLALAQDNAYDVIFLDVQMPGMDGFELCKKIRASQFNQTTPIVFVTCQSDFSSRAQSSLAGGCDLIGKPFLTFEITAKALMLALRNRLSRLKTLEAQAA